MPAWVRAAALPLAIIVAACGRDRTIETTESAAAPEAASADADALCKEHGLLEAVCTQCNPALVAVFKAKGDYCAEHGFPESFCPICHPERGGRPASDVSDDGAPADGTKVRFKTKETARLAGLQLAAAIEAPARSALEVTARIVYDATKVAQINARSPGVVRAIRADVGASVRAGTALAVIESAGVGAERSRLRAALSRVQIAESNHARAVRLRTDQAGSEQSVLTALQDWEDAKAELASVRATLGMIGQADDSGSRYSLTAPIAGVVTQRAATIGRFVDTEEVLFEIVDTSRMWAELDIPEDELSRVGTGQSVALSVEGLGGRDLTGKLTYVAPQIDPHTRTAKARVPLANPDGVLRGNMFARARVTVTGSASVLKVPRAAVQRAKAAQLVFVRLAEDVYEARRVQLGESDGDLVTVSGRLRPGDQVVTVGSFLLKTETLKESIGAGCCEVEEKR